MAGESLAIAVTAGETVAKMPSKEHASKGPDISITTGEAIAGVPSQRHTVL